MSNDVGTNWSGNVAYGAERLETPASIDELCELVRGSYRLRPVGTRHSFNRIADTDAVQVSVAGLPRVVEVDAGASVARVSAGLRYGDVAGALEAQGWALPNLASLPHISVAGAVATGTHGSGDRVPSLAASVAGVSFVSPDGQLHTLARGDEGFDGAVVSLGALGVAVSFDLDIHPSFEVAQTVFENLPLDAVLDDLDAVTGLGYSTSMFTTWQNPDVIEQLWVKARTDQAPLPAEVLGGPAARVARHPLPTMSAEHCTAQLGVPGRWLDRLPHFRLDFQPSNGDELQTEYLVPRQHAVAAIAALRGVAGQIAPLLQVCEIRTVAADGLWLSPAFATDAVGLHFTWLPKQPAVESFLPTLETALEPFAARPHWGKLFARRDVAGLYPRWSDFAVLCARYDPRGVMRNDWMAELGL